MKKKQMNKKQIYYNALKQLNTQLNALGKELDEEDKKLRRQIRFLQLLSPLAWLFNVALQLWLFSLDSQYYHIVLVVFFAILAIYFFRRYRRNRLKEIVEAI